MDETDLDDITYDTVVPTLQPGAMAHIRDLLADRGLDHDPSVDIFCVAHSHGELIACGGISGNVIKCVAVRERYHSIGVLEHLVTELTYTALDRGISHLFLYTKPANEQAFLGCGFHTIVRVPDTVVLMENSPFGISKWTEELSFYRREQPRVGACVVNCNPFTLGHQYLLQQAAADCDYLHVFVVSEDASFFSYRHRLALVRAGVALLPERDRIHVHPGSQYIVSKTTFPTYFIKDSGIIDMAATAVDLRIFREHIAPALGITHRYVGTEPFCQVTRRYNTDMHYWLEREKDDHPPVEVVEIPRCAHDGDAISATEVRRRIINGDLDGLHDLVPPTTYAFIVERYGTPADRDRATEITNRTAGRAEVHETALAALARAFDRQGVG
ncbi:[citrate (pro-3S)-lyase] ligase [Austwickia chelonae]|uniref:[citrate (pro-3S)-lyase] ligase n=1 Tax=Austwickia chelonae TaxID=100225 RepID=UPI000E24A2B4|nr:[citrate (pro-3S)-lyase] ligase [Austwickia chelonae]